MSHRWIWAAYDRAARKIGMQAAWLTGTAEDVNELRAGDLIFGLDVWGDHLENPVKGARYVLHNFPGDHPIFTRLEADQFIRLQVFTLAAHGEKIGECRYWVEENRTLIQPWGTDLFAEEFYEPVFNPTSQEAVFVGAVWDTHGQGNVSTIGALRQALRSNGLKFVHKTQISEQEMIQSIRDARLAPALAGPWQVENDYLPCRVFKNVSYGQPAVTNVGRFRRLFEKCTLKAESIEDLVHDALSMKRDEWEGMVRAQQKVVAGFTYRESLETIDRVFDA